VAVVDAPVGIEINSSQFSVLSSQFSVLSSQFSVLSSQKPNPISAGCQHGILLGTGNWQPATGNCLLLHLLVSRQELPLWPKRRRRLSPITRVTIRCFTSSCCLYSCFCRLSRPAILYRVPVCIRDCSSWWPWRRQSRFCRCGRTQLRSRIG